MSLLKCIFIQIIIYNQLKLGIQYFFIWLKNYVQLLFKAVIKRTTGDGLFLSKLKIRISGFS